MRKIFIPLSKLFGILQLYTGLCYFLNLLPVLPALFKEPSENVAGALIETSFYGQSVVLTKVSMFVMLILTIAVGWILIFKSDWLADRLAIPHSHDNLNEPASDYLTVGIKLIGLYMIVQGIPTIVQKLFYVIQSSVPPAYILIAIVPLLIRMALGFFLVVKTHSIFGLLSTAKIGRNNEPATVRSEMKADMGWLGKLFNATPKEKLNGIRLDTSRPYWEVTGKTTFAALLRALGDFLPEGCILYFEGGSPDRMLLKFFNAHAISEQTHVAIGILWPSPVYYHVPATPENLAELARLAESHAEPELAVNFHVYRNGKVLLQWHDAFSDPMLLDGEIPESKVQALASALGMKLTLNSTVNRSGASF